MYQAGAPTTLIRATLRLCRSGESETMQTIKNLSDALLVSTTNFLSKLLGFIPNLIGAIVILIIGWIIAGIVAGLLDKVLQAVGFERAVDRSGIGNFLKRASTNWTTSKVLTTVIKWFIRLIFIEAAASVLGFAEITTFVNNILNYLPNVVVALVIIVIGSLLATVAADLVRGAVSSAGAGNATVLSAIARYAILGFAVVAALSQLQIAATIVNTLFIGLVAAIALAVGLAFGLGGRDVAADLTRSWYQSGKSMAGQLSQPDGNSRPQQVAQPRPTTYRTSGS
jgi:hypothetical protein